MWFNYIAKYFFKYLDLKYFLFFFFFLERSVVKIRKGAKKDGKFGWLSKRLDKSIKQLSSEAFEPTKIAPVTTLPLEHCTARDPIGENRRTLYLWWSDNTCEQTKKKIVLLNQRLPVFVLHWKLSCVSKNTWFIYAKIYKIDSLNGRLCFLHIGI